MQTRRQHRFPRVNHGQGDSAGDRLRLLLGALVCTVAAATLLRSEPAVAPLVLAISVFCALLATALSMVFAALSEVSSRRAVSPALGGVETTEHIPAPPTPPAAPGWALAPPPGLPLAVRTVSVAADRAAPIVGGR